MGGEARTMLGGGWAWPGPQQAGEWPGSHCAVGALPGPLWEVGVGGTARTTLGSAEPGQLMPWERPAPAAPSHPVNSY